MNNMLFIKSSLNGEQAQSNKLAQKLVSNLASTYNITIIERDLAKQSLPHLSQAEMAAWMTQPTKRSDGEVKLANVSDTLIEELNTSDTIVIGMPMYNFGVPSTFKAWADRVARAGITFRYTENGPIGLLENKKVIVVATRGGIYAGSEKDSQTQFLKDFFSFIGIEDISFIYAEGLNMPGSDQRIEVAQVAIDNFTN
jgi:FMN-dependent NADH-azoreductase